MSDVEKHFGEEAWLSFALRAASADQEAQMQAHLNSGCAECAKIYRLWNLVAETAAREALYEPPRDVVQAVKAVFPFVQKLPILPRLAQSARMIFDSFREPLPVGVRGSGSEARHLLYEVDDFLIDLRLEHEEERRLAVSGQIVPKRDGQARSTEINILVTEGDGRLLRHTAASPLGEFQLELEQAEPLAFYLQFADSSIRVISLPSVV